MNLKQTRQIANSTRKGSKDILKYTKTIRDNRKPIKKEKLKQTELDELKQTVEVGILLDHELLLIIGELQQARTFLNTEVNIASLPYDKQDTHGYGLCIYCNKQFSGGCRRY